VNEAIKRDPENKPAAFYLKLIKEVRFNQDARQREIVAKERLSEVERRLNTSANRDGSRRISALDKSRLHWTRSPTDPSKLDTIRLQEVIYDGVPLGEVVKDLSPRHAGAIPTSAGSISSSIRSRCAGPAHAVSGSIQYWQSTRHRQPEPLDLQTVVIRITFAETCTLGQVIEAISKFLKTVAILRLRSMPWFSRRN
jgi:hypothetical protein